MSGAVAKSLLCAVACVAAILAATGCGGTDKLLPAGPAASLDSTLQQVSDETRGGNCRQALDALRSAQDQAAALPASVDPQLAARIDAGLRQLAKTVPDQCRAAANATPSTPRTTTGATTSEPTTTTTTSTSTTTPTTTTTTTPTTTTTTTPTTTGTSTQPNGGITPEQTATQPGAAGGTP